MSYDLYYSPEKLGLATIGEVEWGDGCYSFDLTVVWRDVETGVLYFADDSGCSCPSPYEDTGRDSLTLIDRPQTFIDHIDKRLAELSDSEWCKDETDRSKVAAAELVLKVREALR
jgi:hypothetical protein